MPKLFYFAHPYSGNCEENFRLANERTIKLLNAGYHIFSPISHSHPLQMVQDNSYKFWLCLDKTIMSRCDGIILAPGWKDSKGCQVERKWFESMGLPILEYEKMDSI